MNKKIENSIYHAEVELDKIKKMLKQGITDKDVLFKQTKEIKWKIFILETVIEKYL